MALLYSKMLAGKIRDFLHGKLDILQDNRLPPERQNQRFKHIELFKLNQKTASEGLWLY